MSSSVMPAVACDLWYHLTDKPRFALDPTHTPLRNTLAGGMCEPGIFLARELEPWFNGYDYVRPFVVEVSAPASVTPDPGMYEGEAFVAARRFHELIALRVLPWDEYVRETFGLPGHIELFHEYERLTLPKRPGDFSRRERRFPRYRYAGCDVREMSETEIARHISRCQAYICAQRPRILSHAEL